MSAGLLGATSAAAAAAGSRSSGSSAASDELFEPGGDGVQLLKRLLHMVGAQLLWQHSTLTAMSYVTLCGAPVNSCVKRMYYHEA
jgi:hypothetical protein